MLNLLICIKPVITPSATPSKEVICVEFGGSIESTPLEGQTACHGDDVCRMVLLLVVSTFCTIPGNIAEGGYCQNYHAIMVAQAQVLCHNSP